MSAFAGAPVLGLSAEKKLEVEGVVHKLLLAEAAEAKDTLLRQAHAFICVFDCSNRSSFHELQARLLGLIVASRGHDATVPVTVVASKCDLPRQVSVAESLQLAKELQTLIKGSVALYEVCSPQGLNVATAVQDTFTNVLQWRCCDTNNQSSSCVVQ